MIKYIVNYFHFFSRIPINYRIDDPVKLFQKGVAYLGVFGLIYGAILSGFYYLLRLRLPVIEAWPLILLLDAILNGAFHHDALADTMDGLFSGRNKERKLEIMKDSRVGTNGVVALIIYYVIMLMLGVRRLNELGIVSQEILFILTIYLISRTALTLTFREVVYKSSSPNGLGNILVGIQTNRIVIAQILALLWVTWLYDYQGLLSYALVIVIIESYKRLVYKEIGGINGDTSGATVLISQMAWLIIWSIIS